MRRRVPATSSAVLGDRMGAPAGEGTASGPIIGANGVLRATTTPHETSYWPVRPGIQLSKPCRAVLALAPRTSSVSALGVEPYACGVHGLRQRTVAHRQVLQRVRDSGVVSDAA